MIRDALIALVGSIAGLAACDSEPALPPAWAIGVTHVDARALGLVDADHPGAAVPALATLTDHPRLTLPTPDGSGQATSPDVIVDVADLGESRILLAATPFPYADERAENPSVFASTDGVTYALPADLTVNPAVPPPDVGHNADPDLRYDPHQFAMVYLIDRPASQTVESLHTAELSAWPGEDNDQANRAGVIFNLAGGDHAVASPTTMIVPPPVAGEAPTTWLFLIDTVTHEIFSLTTLDGTTWDLATRTLALDLAGIAPDKIDLVAGPTGGYAMLISDAHDVYAATSPDLKAWTFNPTPLLTAGALRALTLGRASGVVSGDDLWIWYGLSYDPN